MTRRPHSKSHEMIDRLEPRVLLTYTVTTTNNDDLVEMQYSDGTFSFFLNGQPAGSTADPDITISTLAGSDLVKLYHVPGSADVTVRGGSGNDEVEVGNGRLGDNLLGSVFVEELDDPDDSFDRVVIRDQLDNTATDRPIDVRASSVSGMTHFIRSGLSAGGGNIHFNTGLSERVDVYSSGAADSVYVESVPDNLVLDLGAGNDTAYYGDRATRELPEVMPLGNIYGRDGADRVIFDDQGQSTRQNSTYQFEPLRALNITTSEVEHIELTARPNGVLGTDVDLTGWGGATTSFTVRGENADVNIGTSSTRIDLDSNPIEFNTVLGATFSHVTIYDGDTDADGSDGWVMFRQASQTYQLLSKGDFYINHLPVNNQTATMVLHGGGRNDSFTIGGIMPGMALVIDGGGGDDQLFTNNANFAHGDLDAIFLNTRVRFQGGSGFDTLSLFDANDQINDGDADYNCLGIGDEVTVRKGTTDIAIFEDDVDKVLLTADSDDNTIFFHGTIGGQEFVVDGGPGNDYMSNNSSLNFYSGDSTVTGGLGNDTLAIDDTSGTSTQYTLTSNTFSHVGPSAAGDWLYDSFENLTLDTSQNDSTIRIDSRIPGVPLFVGGRGGNDTITVGGGDFDGNGFGSQFTVLGGAGEDKLVIDDSLDDWHGTDPDTFDISFQTITKDGVGLIYSAFESQKIITSGVNSSDFVFSNTVRIHSTDMPTEIQGTPGERDNVIEIGDLANNLGQIFAPITLSFMPGAVATVNVHDETATAARQYTVTATAMTAPRVINYTGVVGLNVYGGTNSDNFNVIDTPATMPVYLRGYNGDDFMSIGGGGPLAIVQSRVLVTGDAGNDTLFITNGPGGGFTDATITAGTYTVNGGPVHFYETVESFWAIANNAGSDFDVRSTNTATSIYCDDGNDSVHVGAGDITANINPSLYVRGGGGSDLVEYDDTLDVPNLDVYRFDHEGLNFTADRFLRPSGQATGPTVVVTMEGIEQQVLHANEGNSGFQVYKPTSALRINANGGNDEIYAYDTVAPLVVNTGPGSDYIGVNDNGGFDPATVIIEQDDQISRLQIFEGGTLRIASGATLCQTPFTNGASLLRIDGTLDVSGSYLYKPGTSPTTEAAFRTMIKKGRNGGAWNGAGVIGAGAINSSLAANSSAIDGLGYGLGSQIATTSIGGFTIAANDLLIRHTVLGDADLNGVVNFDDYSKIDFGFNTAGSTWAKGDFDYNDIVNFDDYAIIDLAFNTKTLVGSGDATRRAPRAT